MNSMDDLLLFNNLLFFENRLKDDKADYISVTDQYLWRRDSSRLVSFKLDEKVKKNINYRLEDYKEAFEDEDKKPKKLIVNEKGEMVITFEKKKKMIKPITVNMKPYSLKTLYYEEFTKEYVIESKKIMKYLLMVQRKIMKGKQNINDLTIIVDAKQGTISIPEIKDEKKIDIQASNDEKEYEFHYPYPFFKEFLINASQLSKEITFKVNGSYFSIIEYNDRIKAVLNHKRKRVMKG